jgi:large subunit ribosomal protein L1
LSENAKSLIDAVVKAKPPTSKGVYVRSITLAGTMSPGVRVDKAVAR